MRAFIVMIVSIAMMKTMVISQTTSKEELNDLLNQMELVDSYSDENLEASANEIFNELRYSKSSKLLKKMVKSGEFTLTTAEEMAHAHRLNNETQEAEFWYAQVVGKTDNDLTYYHYAKMLLANGKCEDAVTWYREYKKREKQGRNLGFFDSCEEMQNFYEPEYPVAITHPKKLNSKDLDFFAFPINEQDIIFTSNRKRGSLFSTIDEWTGEVFNAIFIAEYNPEKGEYNNPKALKGDFQSDMHAGTPTFLDENHMIFTMNNENDRTAQGNKPLNIFTATKQANGKWEEFKPLNINMDKYSSCHPALNKEKNKLYFASNRPGGFGGMDLYVSEKVNGEWQEPINLGPGVNTAGNEFFPFIHPDGMLFFSSDGHKGFGGYDLFAVRKVENDVETFWSNRVNLGKPYNSLHDELGFTISNELDYGFFTSNRDGGRGEDDIYKWKAEKPINIFERYVDKVFVIRDQDGDLIKNSRVIVELKEGDSKVPQQVEDRTNQEGELSVRVKPFSKYQVTILKEGLEPIVFDVEPMDEWTSVPEVIKIEALELATPFLFELVSKDNIIKENVELKSLRTNESIPVITKEDLFTATVNVNENYEILYKDQFDAMHTFKVIGSQEMRTDGKIYSYEVFSKPPETLANNTIKNTGTISNNTIGNSATNPGLVSETENSANTTNKVMTNGNTTNRIVESSITSSISAMQEAIIFYDFDKAFVKNEYNRQLDLIANALLGDPALMAQIISHTDKRGNATYNKQLAARRSESIKAYLRRKDVEAHRIQVVNKGEEDLPVDCQGPCTSEIHRLNRRSVVRVYK